MEKITIFVDGCSINNPGQSGIGVVGYNGKKRIFTVAKTIGLATNNVAEYEALIEAFNIAFKKKYKDIEVFSDSMLVVQQTNSEWKTKDKNMKRLCNIAKDRAGMLKKWSLKYIPREENTEADELSKEGAGGSYKEEEH